MIDLIYPPAATYKPPLKRIVSEEIVDLLGAEAVDRLDVGTAARTWNQDEGRTGAGTLNGCDADAARESRIEREEILDGHPGRGEYGDVGTAARPGTCNDFRLAVVIHITGGNVNPGRESRSVGEEAEAGSARIKNRDIRAGAGTGAAMIGQTVAVMSPAATPAPPVNRSHKRKKLASRLPSLPLKTVILGRRRRPRRR